MSFFRNLFKRERTYVGDSAWIAWTGSRRGPLTIQSALKISTVYACVKIIAETVSTVPLPLYRRLQGGGKEKAIDHPLYKLLHDSPNEYQTSVEFWETVSSNLALRGNAYSFIEITRGGKVNSITPINPDIVRPYKKDGKIYYGIRGEDGIEKIFDDEMIFHIKLFSLDGLIGLSPIEQARNSLNLTMSMEEYNDKFYNNGSRLSGVLKYPGKLTEQGQKNIRDSWDKTYTGSENSHKVAILEQGLEFQSVGVTNDQAQFLESRKFQVSEICRWYRIPPHMVQDLDKATFSNIEQQSLDFVVNTMRPWFVRIEKAIYKKLLNTREQDTYFAEFLIDGLLRGDIKTRYESYALARQNGWLSVDDIREMENMNPIPEDAGKVYLTPLNMTNSAQGQDNNQVNNATKGEVTTPANRDMISSYLGSIEPILNEAFSSLLDAEIIGCEKLEKKEKLKDAEILYRNQKKEIVNLVTPLFNLSKFFYSENDFNLSEFKERIDFASGMFLRLHMDDCLSKREDFKNWESYRIQNDIKFFSECFREIFRTKEGKDGKGNKAIFTN